MSVFFQTRRHLAAWVLFGCAFSPLGYSQTPESLTLQQAVARVLQQHPQVRAFESRRQAAYGARRQAALKPPLELALGMENMAGSGDMRGLNSAETTLSLSSVFELGGKRGARTALADVRSDQMQLEIAAQTLDLVGAATEQFITTLAAQARLTLAQEAVLLDQSTFASLQQRARAGAASDADVHRAQAALARTRLGLQQQTAELQIARVRLAALWGEPGNPPGILSGDLFALAKADDFAQLYVRAKSSPSQQALTQEERLQQLNAQLARANGRTDLQWTLGLRHLADTDDNALVAGVSVPLFSQSRGRGERLQAEARLGEVQAQRQQAEVELHAKLFETYTRREQAVTAALLLHDQLIPELEQAFALSRQAFERGRYGYPELLAVQRELLEARSESIDSATTALILGAVLEQLTAAPLSSPTPISTPR